MSNAAHGASDHRSNEQAWAEDAAGIPRRVANRSGYDLQHGELRYRLEWKITAQHAIDIVVSNAEYLRQMPSKQSNQKTSHRWLHPDGRLREPAKPDPQVQKQFHET